MPMNQDSQTVKCCLFLSEFDIDTGACFRAVCPLEASSSLLGFDLSTKHDYLANHMLPDGAEKVEIAGTIFILQRRKLIPSQRFPVFAFRQITGGEWTPFRGDGVHISEVLNMSEGDETVSLQFHERVLAGPFSASHVRFEFPEQTPSSVVSLIASLRDESPHQKTDGDPGEAVEDEDFIFVAMQAPGCTLGLVLKSDDMQNLFTAHHKILERIDTPIITSVEKISAPPFDSKSLSDIQRESSGAPLFGVTAVVSKKDVSARRGGVTKAVAAVGSSLPWLQSMFPLLAHCAQLCCDVKGNDTTAVMSQQELLEACFHCIVDETMDMVDDHNQKLVSNDVQNRVLRYCLSSSSPPLTCCMDLLGMTFKLSIPRRPTLDDIDFPNYHLERLLQLFQSQFMRLLCGVITGKRIVVLSRERTAYDVCQVAVVLGSIGNRLHPDFLVTKVFPYVSINETEFADVPGYIIGTMNPIFENAKVWGWDLLCDLDNYEVRSSNTEKKNSAASPTGLSINTLANAVGIGESSTNETQTLPSHMTWLYTRLLDSLQHMQILRIPLKERCLRLNLIIEEYLHTLAVVGHCEGTNISIPQSLINAFFTPLTRALISQCQVAGMTSSVKDCVLMPGECPEIALCCAALRRCNTGDPFNVLRVLERILKVTEREEDILFFLRRMPLAVGGLNPLALQLTHPCFSVRKSAWTILKRVEQVPSGKLAFSFINNFLLILYEEFNNNYTLGE